MGCDIAATQYTKRRGLKISPAVIKSIGGQNMTSKFPERLREQRRARGLSRRTLADLCGLPPDAIRRYERGEALPSMVSLLKLADFLHLSLDELTGRV